VKTATAIVFALVLATAQLLAMPSPLPCSKPAAKSCCHCGGKMICCSERSTSNPAPASPVRVSTQNNFSVLALAVLPALEPPAEVVPGFSVNSSAAATVVPIYEQHCALLI